MMAQQTNNIHPGEEQTLHGLIVKYGEQMPTDIIIPKIQRDYAQGRKGKENLRKSFLNDLFEVIDTCQSQPRLYDYIYGQLEKPNPEHPDSYHFYPVDGQQRLTTMYLLHLYIGKRAGQNVDFLKHFSYQTRNSSSLFCEMLCEVDSKEYVDIISFIKDSDRFTSHWENDPTISSMMRMLHDIDMHFKDKQPSYTPQDFNRCWENLAMNVKFWMLDLSDLDTTDDIYIKMNSRGKGLSPFENFKAELDNLVTTKGKGFEKGEFAMKIDTTWTNLFWDYRNKLYDLVETDFDKPGTPDYTDNGLDDKMLNFFRNYLVIEGLKNGSVSNSKMASRMSAIELAGRVAASSPRVFNDIETILDFFYGLQKSGVKIGVWFKKFLTNIPEEQRFETDPGDATIKINPNPLSNRAIETDYLALFMEPQVTIADKLFAEGIFYLILNKPDTFNEDLHDNADIEHLRILRNLIANSELHDDDKHYHADAMKNNLCAVDTLMQSGLPALKTLRNEFSGQQIDQEINKCNWLADSVEAEKVAMKQLENHSVLRGNLRVLYDPTPLTLDRINNFRCLFKNKADYDEIEQIALSYDDYAIINGDARNYAEGTLNSWKDRIFVNSNVYSLKMFDKMLGAGVMSYQDYVDHKDKFLKDAQDTCTFDWRYYLCKYKSMRWAPKGWYLIDGKRYMYYMFKASTCIHSDTYIHYNVYNDALCCLLKNRTSEDNRGGSLTVSHIGVKVDIQERIISIGLSDGSYYHLDIPENDGVDSIDRVQLGKTVVERLLKIANNGQNFSDDTEITLKKLVKSDLDKEDWPELKEDKTKDTEENSLIHENE